MTTNVHSSCNILQWPRCVVPEMRWAHVDEDEESQTGEKKAVHIVEKLRCCRKSLVCKINLIDFICNVYKLICTHTASHPGLQWKMVQLKFDRRSERERSLIDYIMNYNCPSFVVRCSSFAELAQNDYECAHTEYGRCVQLCGYIHWACVWGVMHEKVACTQAKLIQIMAIFTIQISSSWYDVDVRCFRCHSYSEEQRYVLIRHVPLFLRKLPSIFGTRAYHQATRTKHMYDRATVNLHTTHQTREKKWKKNCDECVLCAVTVYHFCHMQIQAV